MRRTHLIVVTGCLLTGILLFLIVRSFVLSLYSQSGILQKRDSEMIQQLPLTPEQQGVYAQKQGLILLEEQDSILEKIQRNRFWANLWPYIVISIVMSCLVGGFCIAHRKTRPVVTITTEGEQGKTSITTIPIIKETVIERQLVAFAPVARNLALAKGEAQEQALQGFVGMAKAMQSMQLTKGHSGATALQSAVPEDIESQAVLPLPHTPTFRQLIQNGAIAPGQPLIMGYNNGQPEQRTLETLKALGVGGWQGSGKTRSSAYFLGSAIYAYGAKGYLLDPHRKHKESLTAQVSPLIREGFITSVNPFHAKRTLTELDQILNRRLDGQDPCTPAIVVMFDELSRIVKSADDMLSLLIGFIERCTEETRKANILFCGCSPKWTARHFGGRADIRGCLNSMLVHKMKPSQAKLLLEEPEEKELLKQITRPGEGVLVTDFSGPVKVSVPFCQPNDFEMIAERMNVSRRTGEPPVIDTTAKPLVGAQALEGDLLLDGDEIQQAIRSLVADTENGLKLKDIYTQVFAPEDMTFETFRTKYYRPEEREWKPTEAKRLSEQLPLLIEQVSG